MILIACRFAAALALSSTWANLRPAEKADACRVVEFQVPDLEVRDCIARATQGTATYADLEGLDDAHLLRALNRLCGKGLDMIRNYKGMPSSPPIDL